jgi:hypothetical protein
MFLQCMSLLPHLYYSSSRPGTSSGGVSVSGGKVGSVVLMLEEVEGKMRLFVWNYPYSRASEYKC